jgi:hypothetical protein
MFIRQVNPGALVASILGLKGGNTMKRTLSFILALGLAGVLAGCDRPAGDAASGGTSASGSGTASGSGSTTTQPKKSPSGAPTAPSGGAGTSGSGSK